MKSALWFLLIALGISSVGTAAAQEPLARTPALPSIAELMRSSGVLWAGRLGVAKVDSGTVASLQQGAAVPHSWVSRHPALFGALVGAGGGATVGGLAACTNPHQICLRGAAVLFGAGVGAGGGSLIGVIVRRP